MTVLNPLCPRCQAQLRTPAMGDGLQCPDCDYTWLSRPRLLGQDINNIQNSEPRSFQ